MQASAVKSTVSPSEIQESSLETSTSTIQCVNKMLSESVLRGFSHFGNKVVVESLLYILELEHSVNIYNLTRNIPAFRAGIDSMFGGGGYVLEERICEEIAHRLGIKRNGQNLETLVQILIRLAIQKE